MSWLHHPGARGLEILFSILQHEWTLWNINLSRSLLLETFCWSPITLGIKIQRLFRSPQDSTWPGLTSTSSVLPGHGKCSPSRPPYTPHPLCPLLSCPRWPRGSLLYFVQVCVQIWPAPWAFPLYLHPAPAHLISSSTPPPRAHHFLTLNHWIECPWGWNFHCSLLYPQHLKQYIACIRCSVNNSVNK